MRPAKRCEFCRREFKRLDRHHAGRNACSRAAALARTARLPGHHPPAEESVATWLQTQQVGRTAAELRQQVHAFDPAEAGGTPHRQGHDPTPTPTHPDNAEPGEGRPRRRRPTRKRP
jgi:hypothetical protein